LFRSGRSADPRFLGLAALPSPRHLGQASGPKANKSGVAATTRARDAKALRPDVAARPTT